MRNKYLEGTPDEESKYLFGLWKNVVDGPDATTAAEAKRHQRIRLYGAALGGGIPLVAAAFASVGLRALAPLLLWAALVGTLIGWRFALECASTYEPVRVALRAATWAAILGAAGVLWWITMTSGNSGISGLVFVLYGFVIGVILGSLMSCPVALVSVLVLRRIVPQPAERSRAGGSLASAP